MTVNVYEAKTNLSKLMQLLESGAEKEIIFCNRGKPIARCVPISPAPEEPRPFGVLKGKNAKGSKTDFFELDQEIANEFEGE